MQQHSSLFSSEDIEILNNFSIDSNSDQKNNIDFCIQIVKQLFEQNKVHLIKEILRRSGNNVRNNIEYINWIINELFATRHEDIIHTILYNAGEDIRNNLSFFNKITQELMERQMYYLIPVIFRNIGETIKNDFENISRIINILFKKNITDKVSSIFDDASDKIKNNIDFFKYIVQELFKRNQGNYALHVFQNAGEFIKRNRDCFVFMINNALQNNTEEIIPKIVYTARLNGMRVIYNDLCTIIPHLFEKKKYDVTIKFLRLVPDVFRSGKSPYEHKTLQKWIVDCILQEKNPNLTARLLNFESDNFPLYGIYCMNAMWINGPEFAKQVFDSLRPDVKNNVTIVKKMLSEFFKTNDAKSILDIFHFSSNNEIKNNSRYFWEILNKALETNKTELITKLFACTEDNVKNDINLFNDIVEKLFATDHSSYIGDLFFSAGRGIKDDLNYSQYIINQLITKNKTHLIPFIFKNSSIKKDPVVTIEIFKTLKKISDIYTQVQLFDLAKKQQNMTEAKMLIREVILHHLNKNSEALTKQEIINKIFIESMNLDRIIELTGDNQLYDTIQNNKQQKLNTDPQNQLEVLKQKQQFEKS